MCRKCRGFVRSEAAARICVNCGTATDRAVGDRAYALQSRIDFQLRARSAESRALSRCDSCWSQVAPGIDRCERCKLRARLAAMSPGERMTALARAGLPENYLTR